MRTSDQHPRSHWIVSSAIAITIALTMMSMLAVIVSSAAPKTPHTQDVEWKKASPGFEWSFPRDHWSHDEYRTEWWYFTGHLTSEEGKEYGFQFTIFRIGLTPIAPSFESSWTTQALWMGHASISDLDGQRHLFADVLHRSIPLLAGFESPSDSLISWGRGPTGTQEPWRLWWSGDAFAFSMRDDDQAMAMELHTTPEKPLVFQGPEGYSRKAEAADGASLYYSFPRLATEGFLELDGRRVRVTGRSWMDKEFGSNQLTGDQVGWDWFSLQLDDGRDVMLYALRDADGSVDFARGTVIGADGAATYLSKDEWSYESLGTWGSEASGIRYPHGWRVEIPEAALSFDIIPRMKAQENVARSSGGIAYYEGAVEVRVDGRQAGLGYVELTGYGEGNRPPI